MQFVLDASVVTKWYVPEVLGDKAVKLKKFIEEKARPVAVPRYFFIEIANILWKKTSLTKELSRRDAQSIFFSIQDLPLYIIEDRELLLKAIELALDYSISVYDALYLAAALDSRATLVTADSALAKRFAHSNMKKHVLSLADFDQ